MKVVHLPYVYFPDASGGTEYYVKGLAQGLAQLGIDNLIVAPGARSSQYVHEGLLVVRLPVSPDVLSLRELYGEGDACVADHLNKVIDEWHPDIVHFHGFTSAISLSMLKAVKSKNIPTVMTYHTSTVSCPRGTLLRWGEKICDGKMFTHRCSQCSLHGLGMNRILSFLVGALPPIAGQWLGDHDFEGGIWTALRMSELIKLRHQTIHTMWEMVDRVVVLSEWTHHLLLTNEIPDEKMVLIRHGLTQPPAPKKLDRAEREATDPLRLVFLGRMDPLKGPDIIVKALQQIPEANITLDMYGIVQGEKEHAYQVDLLSIISGDKRIRLYPPLAGEAVIKLLQNYDALVVPSKLLETGPLVVLEAFAAGIIVIGSNLGGIAEWVENGKNGILVSPNDIEAWVEALQDLISKQELLQRLTRGIVMPRTIGDVAKEMQALYATLV